MISMLDELILIITNGLTNRFVNTCADMIKLGNKYKQIKYCFTHDLEIVRTFGDYLMKSSIMFGWCGTKCDVPLSAVFTV